jgi:hypothetical protein
MGKNEKSNPNNRTETGQTKRAGTSALIAAASLLGTALGVSDAMAGKTHGTAPPSHSSDKSSPPPSTRKDKPMQFLTFKFKLVAVKSVSAKKKPHTKVVAPVVVDGKK